MTREEALQLLQQNDNLRKFLNVLSISEGTHSFSNPYLAKGGTNGALLTTGFGAHPAAVGQGTWGFKDKLGRNLQSTANGKYAIRYPTWQGIEKAWGKMDFSPTSQDAAAVYLINQRGALNDVLNGNWNSALPKLGKEWASLPTAPDSYQQFRHSWDSIRKAFNKVGLDASSIGGGNVQYAARPTIDAVGSGYAATTKKAGQDLLQQMMQAPKQQFEETPAIAVSGSPAEYATIQWLTKPTGMYGW